MKINYDKVLTKDSFEASYASWKGRTIAIAGDQIQVCQEGFPPRCFDTVYLFEDQALLIGTVNNGTHECYLNTEDGRESEGYIDIAPYIFADCGHLYAVVKKNYKNTDLHKMVTGLTIIEISTLSSIDKRFTWPMWDSIESIHNGAVMINKSEGNYGLASIDQFPTCNLVRKAVELEKVADEENVYLVRKKINTGEQELDFTKKLRLIKD